MKVKIERVNLLPPDMRPQSGVSADNLLIGGFLAVVILMGVVSFRAHHELKQTKQDLSSLAHSKTELSRDLDLIKENEARRNAQKETYELINQVKLTRVQWSEIFLELSSVTPERTWLISINNSFDELGNHKIVLTGEAPSQQKMTEFFSLLENSYYFRHISMKFSEQLENYTPAVFRFQFECLLKTQGKT